MAYSSHGTSPIMRFYLGITIFFISLIPPGECHCTMGVLGSSRKILQNYYILVVSFSNFCFTYLALSKIFSLE